MNTIRDALYEIIKAWDSPISGGFVAWFQRMDRAIIHARVIFCEADAPKAVLDTEPRWKHPRTATTGKQVIVCHRIVSKFYISTGHLMAPLGQYEGQTEFRWCLEGRGIVNPDDIVAWMEPPKLPEKHL